MLSRSRDAGPSPALIAAHRAVVALLKLSDVGRVIDTVKLVAFFPEVFGHLKSFEKHKFSNWRRCWFVLKDGFFFSFSDSSSMDPTKCFSVDNVVSTEVNEDELHVVTAGEILRFRPCDAQSPSIFDWKIALDTSCSILRELLDVAAPAAGDSIDVPPEAVAPPPPLDRVIDASADPHHPSLPDARRPSPPRHIDPSVVSPISSAPLFPRPPSSLPSRPSQASSAPPPGSQTPSRSQTVHRERLRHTENLLQALKSLSILIEDGLKRGYSLRQQNEAVADSLEALRVSVVGLRREMDVAAEMREWLLRQCAELNLTITTTNLSHKNYASSVVKVVDELEDTRAQLARLCSAASLPAQDSDVMTLDAWTVNVRRQVDALSLSVQNSRTAIHTLSMLCTDTKNACLEVSLLVQKLQDFAHDNPAEGPHPPPSSDISPVSSVHASISQPPPPPVPNFSADLTIHSTLSSANSTPAAQAARVGLRDSTTQFDSPPLHESSSQTPFASLEDSASQSSPRPSLAAESQAEPETASGDSQTSRPSTPPPPRPPPRPVCVDAASQVTPDVTSVEIQSAARCKEEGVQAAAAVADGGAQVGADVAEAKVGADEPWGGCDVGVEAAVEVAEGGVSAVAEVREEGCHAGVEVAEAGCGAEVAMADAHVGEHLEFEERGVQCKAETGEAGVGTDGFAKALIRDGWSGRSVEWKDGWRAGFLVATEVKMLGESIPNPMTSLYIAKNSSQSLLRACEDAASAVESMMKECGVSIILKER
jgi:hypothetical protein